MFIEIRYPSAGNTLSLKLPFASFGPCTYYITSYFYQAYVDFWRADAPTIRASLFKAGVQQTGDRVTVNQNQMVVCVATNKLGDYTVLTM